MSVAECSKCGRKLRVPEGFTGKRCRCPFCGEVIALSPPPQDEGAGRDGDAEATAACDREVTREITREIRKRRRRVSPVVMAVGLIAVGAVAVYLVSAAIYWRQGERLPRLHGEPGAGVEHPPMRTESSAPVIPYLAPGRIVVDGRAEDWAGVPMPAGEVGSHEVAHLVEYDMRKAGLAHDGRFLYVIVEIHPGIDERFQRTRSTGSMGYLYVDSDGDEETGGSVTSRSASGGERREKGFEWRAYLPTGFAGGTNKETVSMAGYEFAPVERDGTFGYDAAVPELDRDTEADPLYVAARGNYFEMRVSMEALGLRAGRKARFMFEENAMGVFEKELLWGEVWGILEEPDEGMRAGTDSGAAPGR